MLTPSLPPGNEGNPPPEVTTTAATLIGGIDDHRRYRRPPEVSTTTGGIDDHRRYRRQPEVSTTTGGIDDHRRYRRPPEVSTTTGGIDRASRAQRQSPDGLLVSPPRPYDAVLITVRRRPLVRPVGYYKRCGALGEPSDTDDRSNAFFAFLTLLESTNVYETLIAMRVAADVDPLDSALRCETACPGTRSPGKRPYARSFRSRVPQFLSTNVLTQHCHESVSKDRMALMWRAQRSVGRAIFPRSQTNVVGCIVALTEHQLHGYEWRKEVPGDFSSRLLVRLSEIFDRALKRATVTRFLDVSASLRRSSVRAISGFTHRIIFMGE